MYYCYEIYVKHPETGERGWDIKSGWLRIDHVACGSLTESEYALHKLRRKYLDFDCVIQLYQAIPNPTDVTDD